MAKIASAAKKKNPSFGDFSHASTNCQSNKNRGKDWMLVLQKNGLSCILKLMVLYIVWNSLKH